MKEDVTVLKAEAAELRDACKVRAAPAPSPSGTSARCPAERRLRSSQGQLDSLCAKPREAAMMCYVSITDDDVVNELKTALAAVRTDVIAKWNFMARKFKNTKGDLEKLAEKVTFLEGHGALLDQVRPSPRRPAAPPPRRPADRPSRPFAAP